MDGTRTHLINQTGMPNTNHRLYKFSNSMQAKSAVAGERITVSFLDIPGNSIVASMVHLSTEPVKGQVINLAQSGRLN